MEHTGPGSEYARNFDRTLELIAKLEAFVEGRETTASLQAWAHALWDADGTQEGPIRLNGHATGVLINVFNGDQREDTVEAAPRLRARDALDYIRTLRAGLERPMTRTVATLEAPMNEWVSRLALDPIRHVIDGLGWFEFVQFASPATGRVFSLRNALEAFALGDPLLSTTADGGAADCLMDLFDTLCIDSRDFAWLAPEFEAATFPTWRLLRQDDNGIVAEVERFTGYRKAAASLRKLEASKHKQTYWLASS